MNRVPTSTIWTVEELVWLGERLGQSVKEHGKADRAGIIREFNETFPSKDLNPNKLAGIYTRNGGDQAKFIAWCRKKRRKQSNVKTQAPPKAPVLPAPAPPSSAKPCPAQKPVQKEAAQPPEHPRPIVKTAPAPPREPPRPQAPARPASVSPPKPPQSVIPEKESPEREPFRFDASHDAIIARALAGGDPYDPSMKSGPWVRAAIAVNNTCTSHGRYTDAHAVEVRVGRMIADFLMDHGIDHEQAVNASVQVR